MAKRLAKKRSATRSARRSAKRYIFRAWITIKGKRYYARDYGLRAFRIEID